METKVNNVNETKSKKKQTKKTKKVGKVILWIILILILIFALYTTRNAIIISRLQREVKNYTSSTNYHIKSVANEADGTMITMNYYKKNGKQVAILERKINNSTTKMSIYNNGKRNDTFIETSDSKTVKLNSGIINVQVCDYLQTDNVWQTFLLSSIAKIKTVEVNGTKCYAVSNFFSPNFLYSDSAKSEVYLEKDTGLAIKIVEGNTVAEREYEFNNVKDTIFREPDISEYSLKED